MRFSDPYSLRGGCTVVCRQTEPSRQRPSVPARRLWLWLDEAHSGPFYLRESAIADMIVEAIQYNATILRHYALHAFVVMPNHVHLLATPAIALPKLTKSLKGITAKRANAMLALAGTKFWQEKSYDHLVRSAHEFGRSGIIWRRIRYGQVWFAMPAIIVGRGGRPGGRPRTRGSALQLTS